VAVGGGVLLGIAVGVAVYVGVGVGEGTGVQVAVAVAVNVGLGVRVAAAILSARSRESNWVSAAATRIQTILITAKMTRRVFMGYLWLYSPTRDGFIYGQHYSWLRGFWQE
jgi:hypothetical protein